VSAVSEDDKGELDMIRLFLVLGIVSCWIMMAITQDMFYVFLQFIGIAGLILDWVFRKVTKKEK